MHDLQEALAGDIVTTYTCDKDKEYKNKIELEAIELIAKNLKYPILFEEFHKNAIKNPKIKNKKIQKLIKGLS